MKIEQGECTVESKMHSPCRSCKEPSEPCLLFSQGRTSRFRLMAMARDMASIEKPLALHMLGAPLLIMYNGCPQ
eukprot:1152084-Pelagomonas_calceolata.AAC.8